MRYPLPYAFARRHQLLVEQQDDGSLLLWHGHGVPPGPAWSEVQRKHRIASVQARGSYSIQVADSKKFLIKLLGTNVQVFDEQALAGDDGIGGGQGDGVAGLDVVFHREGPFGKSEGRPVRTARM